MQTNIPPQQEGCSSLTFGKAFLFLLKLTVKIAGSFSAQIVSTPLKDDAGSAEEFMVTMFDISARKIAEELNRHSEHIISESRRRDLGGG